MSNTVKNNDTIKVHYVGMLTSGEIFDSSYGGEPLEFLVGAGHLIKGFDEGVVGMKVDEKKTLTIPANDAYGPVDETLVQKLDKSQLPPDVETEVGHTLVATDPDGEETMLIIRDVADDYIVIDANHPLAGHDLIFEVEVVAIG